LAAESQLSSYDALFLREPLLMLGTESGISRVGNTHLTDFRFARSPFTKAAQKITWQPELA
jgi:hypothetical protein